MSVTEWAAVSGLLIRRKRRGDGVKFWSEAEKPEMPPVVGDGGQDSGLLWLWERREGLAWTVIEVTPSLRGFGCLNADWRSGQVKDAVEEGGSLGGVSGKKTGAFQQVVVLCLLSTLLNCTEWVSLKSDDSGL